MSPLLRCLQREQAYSCVECRRVAEQPRGGRDAGGRYVDAGPGLIVGLARQERMVGGLGLCGKGLEVDLLRDLRHIQFVPIDAKDSLRIAVTSAQLRRKRCRAASTMRSCGQRGRSSTHR